MPFGHPVFETKVYNIFLVGLYAIERFRNRKKVENNIKLFKAVSKL